MGRVNIRDDACVRGNAPRANTRSPNLDTIKATLAGSDECVFLHAEEDRSTHAVNFRRIWTIMGH